MSSVLLVEDHASFSESFAMMLEGVGDLEVVGQAVSVGEARRMSSLKPDVAVVDLGLPDGSGADVIRDLGELSPETKVLVLTASVEREEVAQAIEAGAEGFLHKSSGMTEVIDAIRRLVAGEVLLPPEETIALLRLAARRREEWHRQRMAVMKLTPREIQVLEALAEGLDSEEVARKLGISVETERTHIVNLLGKLGAHSRLEAVVIAVRHGVVEITRAPKSYL